MALNLICGDGFCSVSSRKRCTGLQGTSLSTTPRIWLSQKRFTSGLHTAQMLSIDRLNSGIICFSRFEGTSSEIECVKVLTREIVEARNWRQLVDCLEKSRDIVNLRHMTTALYFLSKFPETMNVNMPNRLFQNLKYLESSILASKEDWSSTSIANTLQAYKKLPTEEFRILASVPMKQLLAKPRTLTKKDMVSILSALVAVEDSELKQKVVIRLERALVDDALPNAKTLSGIRIRGALSEFTSQDVGLLSWSLTELSCVEESSIAVFNHCSNVIGLTSLNIGSFALLLRLISTRGSEDVKVTMLEESVNVLSNIASHRDMPVRDCVMILLGLARLVRSISQLSKSQEEEVTMPKWRDTVTRYRTNIIKLDKVIQNLCDLLNCHLSNAQASVEQEAVTSILYSLCLLQFRDDILIRNCVMRILESQRKLTLRSIATSSWSLAVLRYDDHYLMDILAERICQGKLFSCDINPIETIVQPMAMILHGYATLNRFNSKQSRELLQHIMKSAAMVMPLLSAESLPTFGWSLIVANNDPDSYKGENFQKIMRTWRQEISSRVDVIPKLVLPIVHHVEIALAIHMPELGLESEMPYVSVFNALYSSGRVKRSATYAWNEQLSPYSLEEDFDVSFFQRQVFTAAKKISSGWILEYWDPELQYPVDMALPQYRIAVEADGPSHFAHNSRHTLGATSLKQRLLEALGWTVITVPFYEWNNHHSEESKYLYLCGKLENKGFGLESGRLVSLMGNGSLATALSKNSSQEYPGQQTCGDTSEKNNNVPITEKKSTIKRENSNKNVSSIGKAASTLDQLKVRRGKLSISEAAKKTIMRRTRKNG
eukprot:jgi/Picsp_1/6805/NSC_04144-R1_protein